VGGSLRKNVRDGVTDPVPRVPGKSPPQPNATCSNSRRQTDAHPLHRPQALQGLGITRLHGRGRRRQRQAVSGVRPQVAHRRRRATPDAVRTLRAHTLPAAMATAANPYQQATLTIAGPIRPPLGVEQLRPLIRQHVDPALEIS